MTGRFHERPTDPLGERVCPACRTHYSGEGRPVFCPREGAYLVTEDELATSDGDRLLGRRIDEFAIAARIGVGGMGTVYRAIQIGVDRPVALKILHRELMGNAEVVGRFLQEAKAMARLKHRHLATTYTSGRTDDGLPYIAMEYLAGGSLRALIDGSFATEGGSGDPVYTLPAARALRLTAQVVAGLAHAHRQGIVHRDLKPDNVLIAHDEEEGEQAKIVDFGIAKLLDRDALVQTKQRALLGTALYMAPELFQSPQADPRIDVYAVGLLLYELLSGYLPFEQRRAERERPMLLVNKRLLQPVPPLRGARGQALPTPLCALCAELLDLEPLRRPANATEVRVRMAEVMRFMGLQEEGLAPSGLFTLGVSGAVALGSASGQAALNPELTETVQMAPPASPLAPPPAAPAAPAASGTAAGPGPILPTATRVLPPTVPGLDAAALASRVAKQEEVKRQRRLLLYLLGVLLLVLGMVAMALYHTLRTNAQ